MGIFGFKPNELENNDSFFIVNGLAILRASDTGGGFEGVGVG